MSKKPPTSYSVNSLESELRFAGDHDEIERVCGEIERHLASLELPPNYWTFVEIGRGQKKNFAQRFSAALAQKVADVLRPRFKGIYPDEDGKRQESKVKGAGGLKKLDVNYSPGSAGLGLSISIKTLNFKDRKSRRYTKNMRRIDGELRPEAQDVHRFFPYAVLGALILFPESSATDGAGGPSSLKHASTVFRRRGGRVSDSDDVSKFETLFIGTYSSAPESFGTLRLFDPAIEFPDLGLPPSSLTLVEALDRIVAVYDVRDRT